MKKITDSEFETFYLEYMPRVYNFFRYRFTEDMLAEDLTSLTFEKAWKHRSRYQYGLSALSTWIFTIARRIAIDHFRRKKVDIPIDEVKHLTGTELLEEKLNDHEQLDQLCKLMEDLAEREKEIVSLKYGAGLNNRQIAKLVNLSESNVGVILHRTVNKLRAKWEKNNE
jgi:RNA polymerase sigma-70 factor (ECF subfamily)